MHTWTPYPTYLTLHDLWISLNFVFSALIRDLQTENEVSLCAWYSQRKLLVPSVY